MKKKLFAGLISVSLLVALICAVSFAAPAPEKAPQEDPEKVLAKVDKFEIKQKDLDQVLMMMGQQAMMYNNDEGRKAIIDDLVNMRLFSLDGAKKGLEKDKDFLQAVENFRMQALARAAVESVMKNVTVSDEELKDFYDKNPDRFTTPEEIHAKHILISDDVKSADNIKLVQAELKKGTSFDVLAKEHSTCPSAPQGGDLGFFRKGQMVPEFENVAFALKKPGDVSEPVKSSFGWHIIRLEEKKEPVTLKFDDVKAQIVQYLTGEKQNKAYQDAIEALKKQYKVELFLPVASADSSAAQNVSADKK